MPENGSDSAHVRKLYRSGNSIVVSLGASERAHLGLDEDSRVVVRERPGCLVLEPLRV